MAIAATQDLQVYMQALANASGLSNVALLTVTGAYAPGATPITNFAALSGAQMAYSDAGNPLTVLLNNNPPAGAAFAAVGAETPINQAGTANDFLGLINTSMGQVLTAWQATAAGTQARIEYIAPTIPSGPTSLTQVTGYSPIITTLGITAEQIITGAGIVDSSKELIVVATCATTAVNAAGVSNFGARALASAINNNSSSQFWAMVRPVNSNGVSADMVYVFTKNGGNYNDLLACEVSDSDVYSRSALNAVSFENTETALFNNSGTTFSLGGQHWGTMKPIQTKSNLGNEVWNVTLNGRDVGYQRDLWIANAEDLDTPALTAAIINGMDRNSFVEIQNAANGDWAGAEVRTQSSAQEALDAISESITAKDKIRADLGALQNRLENTMTNLTIQAENLQASESRISDVDVATEMTEFTRNNVLAQAATSMLAQANSLSQLALSLIW
jgi:flagellin-like hook-associated protein FlgL